MIGVHAVNGGEAEPSKEPPDERPDGILTRKTLPLSHGELNIWRYRTLVLCQSRVIFWATQWEWTAIKTRMGVESGVVLSSSLSMLMVLTSQ